MKKVFIIAIIVLISILMTGCSNQTSTTVTSPNASPAPVKTVETVQAPTPGPNSLVISRDVFIKDGHQDGEIHIAPGGTFNVNLPADAALNRVWEDTPEITNEGVANKVDYQSTPALQTWHYRTADKGACMVLFKTSGQANESKEWTYSLIVVVASGTLATFTGNYTHEQMSLEVSDSKVDYDNMVYSESETHTFADHGVLEGEQKSYFKYYADMHTGDEWFRGHSIFTGTVDGKTGTLDIYWVGKGGSTLMKGEGKCLGVIVSGTGELANLRGISDMHYIWKPKDLTKFPPVPKVVGTTKNTLWYLE